MPTSTLIAKWKHKSGKYWVTLTRSADGSYTYDATTPMKLMGVSIDIGADTYRLPPKSAAALMVAEFGEDTRNIDITGPRLEFDAYWAEIDRLLTSTTYVLVVEHAKDEVPLLDAAHYGPFASIGDAQEAARAYRESNNIPGHKNAKPIGEENEEWTDAGWTFGIFELKIPPS